MKSRRAASVLTPWRIDSAIAAAYSSRAVSTPSSKRARARKLSASVGGGIPSASAISRAVSQS